MAIQANLDDYAEVTVWSQGVFQLADTAIGALVRALGRTDFAVFVFAPTAGMFRNAAPVVAPIAEVNNYLLPVWMIVFGVSLIRYRKQAA